MLPYEDATSLPLLYHLNSEPWLNHAAYADPAAAPEFLPVAEPSRAVSLPPPNGQSALASLLAARKSCRTFALAAMPLTNVAQLLDNAYGIIDLVVRDNGLRSVTRPVPSAGGLYPLDLRVATTRVTGIADAIYRYNVLHRCLEPDPRGQTMKELSEHLLTQYFLRDANLVFFLSAVFDRTCRKYGARGYRYVLIEAGHVAQNLCLSATELQLGSLCVGGFRDQRLNRALALDEGREAVIYCVGVGTQR